MAVERIRVEGLAQFVRGLKKLDSDLPKTVRVANNAAAVFLIDKTRPLIPRRSGAAANSLVARSTQRVARIAVGGKKAPYYPWLDFGGSTGINKSVDRPFYSDGRYLYPTLNKYRDGITEILENEITAVAERAGLEVD